MVRLSVPAVSRDGDDTRATTLQKLVEGFRVQTTSFTSGGRDGKTWQKDDEVRTLGSLGWIKGYAHRRRR